MTGHRCSHAEEPTRYATTWRELWQHIKADRAKQVRSLVLLLAIFVGCPLAAWAVIQLPPVGKLIAVIVAIPTMIWAWRGLRPARRAPPGQPQ